MEQSIAKHAAGAGAYQVALELARLRHVPPSLLGRRRRRQVLHEHVLCDLVRRRDLRVERAPRALLALGRFVGLGLARREKADDDAPGQGWGQVRSG